jgi:hypothetical protein
MRQVIYLDFRPWSLTSPMTLYKLPEPGLIERYNEIGNNELSEILGNARDYLDSGGPTTLDSGGPTTGVRDFIELGATRLAALHGLSYWRAELRRQVAMAPGLMTWLRQ